jgi:hypothetical protein
LVGAATVHVTRGSRGWGVNGGAVPGVGSTARGPADRGRPRRADPAQPQRCSVRDAGVRGRG